MEETDTFPHDSLVLCLAAFSVYTFFLNRAFDTFAMSVVYMLKMVLVLQPAFLVHQQTSSQTCVVAPRITHS